MPTTARLLTHCLAAAAVLAPTLPVQAESSPFSIGGSLAVNRESNLFRVADDAVLTDGSSRSDTSTVASVFGSVDQALGRQRLYGNASLRANRFSRNERLDYDGYALGLGLDWASAERVSGNLNARASRTLRPFSVTATTTPETRKNLQTDAALDAIVRLGVVSELTAEAALGWGETDYSEAAFANEEVQRSSGSLGLRWRPGGNSSLGLALRQTDGRYPQRGTRFERTDVDITGTWQPSGASSLAMRLSPGRTRNHNADGTTSSSSSSTGALNWRWQPSAKLALTSQILRSTNQDSFNQRLLSPGTGSPSDFVQVNNSNDTRSTLYQLSADWEISSKISATATLGQVNRTISRTGDFSSGTFDNDRTRLMSLALRWNPLLSVQVGCDIGSERRSAGGQLSSPYDASSLGCSAQFTLR